MAENMVDGPVDADGETASLSRAELFDALGNDRRRYALEVVLERDGPVELDELVDSVAAQVNGEMVSDDERKAVYSSLRQTHLPKMEEQGLITWDSEAGTVEPSETLTDLNLYLDVVEGGSVPFSVVYLGLSGVGVAVLTAAWFDVYPVTMLADAVWVTLLTGAFGLTSLVYLHHMRERRVGPESLVPDDAVEVDADTTDVETGSIPARVGGVVGGGLLGGLGMWWVIHYVTFQTPVIMVFYGLETYRMAMVAHLGHSLVAAVPFALAVSYTRLRTLATSAGETAVIGGFYGVGLWVVVSGCVMPNITSLAVPSLLTVGGYELLYLPLDALAGHVLYGVGLGLGYAVVRRTLSQFV